MSNRVPVLIVGAGISGLVCAHALRKSGIDAQIVEASLRPGGMIRTERGDGFLLELGPQSFTATPQIVQLCRDLGIQDQLIEAPSHAPRFLLLNGQLRQAPLTPPAFFASSLFSLGTKWRLLRDLVGRSVPPDSDESVAAFIRRKFSHELLDKLVGPMISGIYAGDPEKLSLRAAFPQLHEAEQIAGSVIRGALRAAKPKQGPKRKPTIFSFRDGNETLNAALAAKLGAALRAGTAVVDVLHVGSPNSTSYEVTLSTNGSTEKLLADNLILSIPAQAAGNLLRTIHPGLSSLLASIEYAPIAVVSLGYAKAHVQHSLDGFGFLIPRSEKLRILGTVFNSSLFPDRATGDNVLLTAFLGGATDLQAASLSPEDLVALVHKELASILSIQQPPVFSHVQVYKYALPQYTVGHARRIASLEKLASQLSGLWFAGNYLHGPSIGSCVDYSLSIADALRAQVKQNFAPG